MTCVELQHRESAVLSLAVIEESIVGERVVPDIHHRSIDFDQSSFFAVEDIVLDRVLRKAKLGIGNVAINVEEGALESVTDAQDLHVGVVAHFVCKELGSYGV